MSLVGFGGFVAESTTVSALPTAHIIHFTLPYDIVVVVVMNLLCQPPCGQEKNLLLYQQKSDLLVLAGPGSVFFLMELEVQYPWLRALDFGADIG